MSDELFTFKLSQGKVAGGLVKLPLSYYSYKNQDNRKKLIHDGTEINITAIDDLVLKKDGRNYVIKYKSGREPKENQLINGIVVNKKSIIGKDKSDVITLLDSYHDCQILVKNVQFDRKNFALELSCGTGSNKKKTILNFINFNDPNNRILTQYPYLAIKKDEENGRYIGCISDESGDCKDLIGSSSSKIPYQIPIDNIGTNAEIKPSVLNTIVVADKESNGNVIKNLAILLDESANNQRIVLTKLEDSDKREKILSILKSNTGIFEVLKDYASCERTRCATLAVNTLDNLITQLKGQDILTSLRSAVIEDLRGNPVFKGPQGPKGQDADSLEVANILKQDTRFKQEVRGEKGLQGERGPAGPKGDRGEQGELGPQGPKGQDADSLEVANILKQDTRFKREVRGEKGLQGERGPAGPKGDRGEQGERGPAGPKGDRGEQGERGPAGPKGDRGEQGENGINGQDARAEDIVAQLVTSDNLKALSKVVAKKSELQTQAADLLRADPSLNVLSTVIKSSTDAWQDFTLQKGKELSDDIYEAEIVSHGRSVATLPKIGYYMLSGEFVMRNHITKEEVKIPKDFHYLKVTKSSSNNDYQLTFCNFLGNEFFEYKKYDPQYSNISDEYRYISLNHMKKGYNPKFCILLNHQPSFFITEGIINSDSPDRYQADVFELTKSEKGRKMATLIDQFGFFDKEGKFQYYDYHTETKPRAYDSYQISKGYTAADTNNGFYLNDEVILYTTPEL